MGVLRLRGAGNLQKKGTRSSLARRQVAATKVFHEFADTDGDEDGRPVAPKDPPDIDVRQVLDQEHRSNCDQD